MERIEPRPTQELIAAALAVEAIPGWLRTKGMGPANKPQFDAAVMSLFSHSDDAYTLAKVAEHEWDWPADTNLVFVLSHALAEGKRLLPEKVKEWVMRTGVRFPRQVRDPVLFYDKNGELTHGVVQNVLKPTAEAIVAVVDDLTERNAVTQLIKLPAEKVIERHAAV